VFTSVSYVVELRIIARKTHSVDTHTAFLIRYQGAPPPFILSAAVCKDFLSDDESSYEY